MELLLAEPSAVVVSSPTLTEKIRSELNNSGKEVPEVMSVSGTLFKGYIDDLFYFWNIGYVGCVQ